MYNYKVYFVNYNVLYNNLQDPRPAFQVHFLVENSGEWLIVSDLMIVPENLRFGILNILKNNNQYIIQRTMETIQMQQEFDMRFTEEMRLNQEMFNATQQQTTDMFNQMNRDMHLPGY